MIIQERQFRKSSFLRVVHVVKNHKKDECILKSRGILTIMRLSVENDGKAFFTQRSLPMLQSNSLSPSLPPLLI